MKLPIDNVNGLIVTLSVKRKDTGYEMSHYMEDKSIKSEGQFINIAKEAARLLWESKDIKKI